MTTQVHTDEAINAQIERIVIEANRLISALQENAEHAAAHDAKGVARDDTRRAKLILKARDLLSDARYV